jgi:dephospho-CoA kinase
MKDLFPNITVIAITGKIGSGKSEATNILKELGAHRIDCDEIVHSLYKPEALGTQKIETFFGKTLMDKNGGVDRKKLAKILYKREKKWTILNRLIHPLVAHELRTQLQRIKKGIVVIEIQIYNDRLFKPFIDELWTIETLEEIRKERLKQRGLTPEQIEIIGRQQTPPKSATRHITNNETEETLKITLKKILNSL